MGEVLADIDPQMPEGYDQLDRVEILKQENGQFRTNGIITLGSSGEEFERKIQLPDPLEIWGYEAEDWEKYRTDPEKWAMRQHIEALEHQIAEENQQHAAEVRELRAEIQTLKEAIDLLTSQLAEAAIITGNQKEEVKKHLEEASPEEKLERPEETRPEPPVMVTRIARVGGKASPRPATEPAPPHDKEQRRSSVREVTEYTRENPVVSGLGALAVGAAGFAIGEVIEHAFFGGSSGHLREVIHNQTIEINKLNHLNEHLSDVDSHLTGVINRDHQQEMRAIHKLQHARANIKNTGFYWAVRYPWDWAANKVGAYRATPWLQTLAHRAQAHGHKVQWLFNGYLRNGSRDMILKVDGTTNTQSVIRSLSHYQH